MNLCYDRISVPFRQYIIEKGCKLGAGEKTYVESSGGVGAEIFIAPLFAAILLYKNTYSSSVAHRNNAARGVTPRIEHKRAACQVLTNIVGKTSKIKFVEVRTVGFNA